MLTTEAGVHELEVLWHHFASTDDGVALRRAMKRALRRLSTALWRWPRTCGGALCFSSRHGHGHSCALLPRLSASPNKFAVSHEVFAAEERCLDAGCTRKARNLYPNAQAMVDCPEFRSCMLSWGKVSPFCNMLIERLLSLIKRACPADCNSSSPKLENLLGLGFVTQILTDHVTHGGDDPRASRRQEFLN